MELMARGIAKGWGIGEDRKGDMKGLRHSLVSGSPFCDSRNLCVVHNVTTRLRPELFLPVGDDVGVLVASSVVDRSNSDCSECDRNVPRCQFPYGISISS